MIYSPLWFPYDVISQLCPSQIWHLHLQECFCLPTAGKRGTFYVIFEDGQSQAIWTLCYITLFCVLLKNKTKQKNHTGFKHDSCILGDKKTKHNAVWFMMGEMVLNRRQTSNFFIAMPCFTSGVYRNHTQSSASTWLFGLIRYRCIEQCCTTVQWYSSHSVLIPSVSPL